MKTSARPIACGFALAAGGTFGLMFASPAGAADETVLYTSTNGGEEVQITAPRYAPRGDLGGPIRNVAIARQVPYGDLDLRTDYGERALKTRITSRARMLCHQMDVMHPVMAHPTPDCYRTATEDALAQVDAIIAARREVASR